MWRLHGQQPSSSTNRRFLALEALESRAVPAAAPLNALLDIDQRWSVYLQGAALKPDGEVRIVGDPGLSGTAWDFDQMGHRVGTQSLRLPQYANQTADRQLISPDGSWLVNQYYDFDKTPGHVWNPVVAIWNGTDTEAALRVDVSSLPRRYVNVRGISNSGDLILTSVQSSYRWNAATGLVALAPLPIPSTEESPFAIATAISADGSVVVGYTFSWPNSVPTFWDSAGPHPLAAPGDRGSAIAASDDGRVIAGVLEQDYVHHAVVWVDGTPTELRDENGELVTGTIRTVVNGLGGDPTRWAVLGESGIGQPWIAFSDGMSQPLSAWLGLHYGIGIGNPSNAAPDGGLFAAGITGLYSVVDAFAYDGALEIVIADLVVSGWTAGIPGSAVYSQSTPHLIIAPLTNVAPTDPRLLDVNNDGVVSPLDALIIINILNTDGPGPIADRPELVVTFPQIDTSRDGNLSAIDILYILNFLNGSENSQDQFASGTAAVAGEGEGEASASDDGSLAWILATAEVFINLPRRRV